MSFGNRYVCDVTGSLLLLTAARPSSLHRPEFSFPNNGDNFSSRYVPIILYILASSKLTIVTSNDGFSPPFTQVPSLLNKSNFRVTLIASITLSTMMIMVLE